MFEYSTQVKVATITLWNLGAVLVHVAAYKILSMKAQRNASLNAFFIVQSSMVIWLFGKVCKTVSPNAELRWFFIVFYYFGVCLLEISFFDFAYLYSTGHSLAKKFRISIYGLGFFQFLVVATNPYHYLFYSKYGFWGDDFGPLFYVHVVINYLFILAGMILCGRKFKEHLKHRKHFDRNLIYLAIFTPLIFNFIYISRTLEALFDYLDIQVFDITPLVYTWSILVFVYATFKFDFFDLTPLMKHEIMERLDSPILVVNPSGAIIYANQKAKEEFSFDQEVLHSLGLKTLRNTSEILHYGDAYYRIHCKKLASFTTQNTILSFNDITSYRMIEIELEKKNQDLNEANEKLEKQIHMLKQTSIIGARNFVSRELHDIIGHSLVVSMKLLEVAKLSFEDQTLDAKESLEKAKATIQHGFQEMKQLMARTDSSIYSTALLERDLKKMFRNIELSGVRINLYHRGESMELDERVFDIIKKVTTELVTNSLKHGAPSQLLLSLHMAPENIRIQYMDNGQGAPVLMKGNGLKGIDERLALINGLAKHSTSSGEGFTTLITLPSNPQL